MQRTDQQRKSIEVYCREVAKALNDAGYEYRELIEILNSKGIETPFTQENIKDDYFKRIEYALFKKTSTTELTTGEVNEIFEVMTKSLANNFEQAQYVPFPSEEDQ